MAAEVLQLDSAALAGIFRRQGAKQWLVARQLGVHPRTVSRWLAGRVTGLERGRLSQLASILRCEEGELLRQGPQLPSGNAIREAAAQAITQSDLLALLSPSGNWALIEKLVLATLEPGLASAQRGRLLNILSIACWRQGHYKAARRHALHALSAGEEAGCPGVMVKARFNIATLDSFEGRYEDCVRSFEECCASPDMFDTPRDYGSALANLAMAYRDCARLHEALATLSRAAEIFERPGARFNSAIACAQRCTILVELGEFRELLKYARLGARIGREIGDEYKLHQMALCEAEALALVGQTAQATALAQPQLGWLATGGRSDPELYTMAARVLRLAGDLPGAGRLLEEGWPLIRRRGLSRGLGCFERARLGLALGDTDSEQRWRSRANRVFRDCGLHRRVRRGPVVEQGAMFSAAGAAARR